MENIEKEIRKGIKKLYNNSKKLKKLREGEKGLFLHLEKIKKSNSSVENKIITI